MNRFSELPAYYLYRFVEAILRFLPVSAVLFLGRLGGSIAWLVAWRYRKLALRNIDKAYGDEKSYDWKKKKVWQNFVGMGESLFMGVKLPSMDREEIESLTLFEGVEHLEGALAGGNGAIGMTMHMSCWELLTQIHSDKMPEFRAGSIFQALRNERLNNYLLSKRESKERMLFDRKDGFVEPLKMIREGGFLVMLSDQHSGRSGVWCPLFSMLCSTSSLPATLAKRAQVPIVPFAVFRNHSKNSHVDGAKKLWKLVFLPPVEYKKQRSVEKVTAELGQIMEQMIRPAFNFGGAPGLP